MCVVIEALQVHLPTCWPRLCFIVDVPTTTTTTTTTTFVNDYASFTYQNLPGHYYFPKEKIYWNEWRGTLRKEKRAFGANL
uniref:Uncharacterized protein n=1 Tax=Vespula pensylvanica TaxID=30213 RepID=A0A834NQD5_VESPE|nr:hypothetical protein H0235_012108 [Vespula pensylvanica]